MPKPSDTTKKKKKKVSRLRPGHPCFGRHRGVRRGNRGYRYEERCRPPHYPGARYIVYFFFPLTNDQFVFVFVFVLLLFSSLVDAKPLVASDVSCLLFFPTSGTRLPFYRLEGVVIPTLVVDFFRQRLASSRALAPLSIPLGTDPRVEGDRLLEIRLENILFSTVRF